MTEILQQFKELSEQEQAAYSYARGRTRSFRDPTKGLFRTHRFGVAEASITTADVFPSRTTPVTFCTEIAVAGLPTGVVFEFGTGPVGTILAVNDGNLEFAAGSSGAGNGISSLTIAVPGLNVSGSAHHIVVAVNPGSGKGRIWVDGIMRGRIENIPPAQFASGWSSLGPGSVGSAVAGSANLDVPTNTAPNNFILIKPFEVFMGQVPRQFNA